MIGRDIAAVRSRNPRKKRGLSCLSLSRSLLLLSLLAIRVSHLCLSREPSSRRSPLPHLRRRAGTPPVSSLSSLARYPLYILLLLLVLLLCRSVCSIHVYEEGEVTLLSSHRGVHGPRSCPDSGRSIGFLPLLRDPPSSSLGDTPFRFDLFFVFAFFLVFSFRLRSPLRRRYRLSRRARVRSMSYKRGRSTVFK